MGRVLPSCCSPSLNPKIAAAVAIFAAISTPHADAHTAVLFGATGAVGSQIFWALLDQTSHPSGNQQGSTEDHGLFWSDLVLVGRREVNLSEIDVDVDPSKINVTQVAVPDLTQVHQNDELCKISADVCFIAVGAGNPQDGTLRDWHAVGYVMAGSIARLCKNMSARYISLLSAVDSESDPEPFSEAELGAQDTAIGWWGMLVRYARMKGLAEQIVASSGIPYVSLVKPSNIVTEVSRYGWLDKTLFKILPYIDAPAEALSLSPCATIGHGHGRRRRKRYSW